MGGVQPPMAYQVRRPEAISEERPVELAAEPSHLEFPDAGDLHLAHADAQGLLDSLLGSVRNGRGLPEELDLVLVLHIGCAVHHVEGVLESGFGQRLSEEGIFGGEQVASDHSWRVPDRGPLEALLPDLAGRDFPEFHAGQRGARRDLLEPRVVLDALGVHRQGVEPHVAVSRYEKHAPPGHKGACDVGNAFPPCCQEEVDAAALEFRADLSEPA